MPELIRAIAARVREYVGNRRRAQRYHVRLSVSVAPAPKARPVRVSVDRNALYGHTRDISSTGLALILPAIRISNVYLAGEGRELEILLEHEDDPVVVYATPVRYEKLDEEAEEKGYLLGVQIVEMSDADRERYMSLLK
jgi:c-di-GMP-binding flagellar brake protein YcgR